MRTMAMTSYEAENMSGIHRALAQKIMQFMDDLGEDHILTLEFDEPNGDFSYLLHGTSLGLEFTSDRINVTDFDFVTGNEGIIASFSPQELNKAVHWLLTTAKQANTSS